MSATRHIAKERFLSDRFTNPVVMEATVVECANSDIIFLCQTSLGTMGSMGREFTLRVKGKTMEKNKAELETYTSEVIELRDILENLIGKFRRGVKDFNIVETLCGERPLMFQAILNEKESRLNIFGHGLYDMSLHHSRKQGRGLAQFIMRLEELINPINLHLSQIAALPLSKLDGTK